MTDTPLPAGYTLDAPTPALPEGYALDAPAAPKPQNNFVFSRAPGGGASKVNTPQESFLDNTSVGRVLDAFGQGAKDGWGTAPVGLSAESEKALRDWGVFNDYENGRVNLLKGFNEALIRPVAATLDGALRLFPAANQALAEGAGQTGQELGMTSTEAHQLSRDLYMMGEMAGVAAGDPVFMGTAVPKPTRSVAFKESTVEAPRAGIPGEPAVAVPKETAPLGAAGQVEVSTGSSYRRVGQGSDDYAYVPTREIYGTDELTNTQTTSTPYFKASMEGQKPGHYVTRKSVSGDENTSFEYLHEDGQWYPMSKMHEVGGARVFATEAEAHAVAKQAADTRASQFAAEANAAPTTMNADSIAPATLKSESVTAPAQVMPATNPAIDQAGNINLNRIQAPADVKQVIREAAQSNDDFNFARRGTISLAETEETAKALGMTPKELLKRNIGEAFNAEQITAARNLAVQSAVNVRELAAKVQATGAEADLIAFQEGLARHALIQEQVAGATAEAGRALGAFRIMAKTDGELADVIAAAGGRENLEGLARQINQLDTPQKVSKFINDAKKASTMEQIIEAWKAGLLTNPVTHGRNILGNLSVALWRTAETGVAAGIGGVRRLAGAGDDAVLFSEVGERITGMVQGAIEGVQTAGKAFKLGAPTDDLMHGTIDARNMRAIPGVAGEVIRTPFKFLAAEDEIFRGIAKRQSINQQALRKARKEGLRGDAYRARVVELKENPTPAMVKRAIEDADYQTFTKKLGPAGQKIQSVLDQYPVARIIIPFFRTPTNILKFAGERTPLSLASKDVRAVLRGEKGAAARDEQIAKMVVGSAVATAAATMAARGLITGGGPKDPAERGLMRMTGWQPYSVLIGDTYYSYAGIEPMATLLGISADAVDIAERASADEGEHIGTSIAYAASTNVMSKTWLQGMSTIIEAAQDPERYGGKFVNKLVGSAIPAGVAQVARLDDPVLRDARTMIDTIKSRTPGLSEEVYAVRDIFGDKIVRGDSLGPDAISPIYTARLNQDPAVKELLSLGIFPSKPDRQIRGVELTPQQYDDYQRISGKLLKVQLDSLVNVPGWADVPAFARRETITKTISRTRETARSYVLMNNPDIIAKATRAKLEDMGVPFGQ